MSTTSLTLKKGRIVRLVLTILDLWEGRGRRHDIIFTLNRSLDIDNDVDAHLWSRSGIGINLGVPGRKYGK